MEVTDELREAVEKRFARVARQVSELATLRVELSQAKHRANADRMGAEATLTLKDKTIHAEETSEDMIAAIQAMSDDIRRQVKRHREMRRKRTQTRRLVGGMRRGEAAGADAPAGP
jgi:putative sigma-54 modulation protein